MALTLDDLNNAVNDIKSFLKDNISLLNEAVLKQLAALIGKLLHELLKVLVNGMNGAQLGPALKEIADKLADIWEAIVDFLQKSLKDAFPSALVKGPTAGIDAAVELSNMINAQFPTFGLANRVDIVADSFTELLNQVGNPKDVTILSQGTGVLKKLLSGLTSAGSSQDKIFGILNDLLLPSKTQVVKLLKSAAKGRWWGWAELPSGFTPGSLHAWVNDPSSYTKITSAGVVPMNAALIPLARKFRCQIVLAVDAFLRSKVSQSIGATSLANSDGRMSYQGLTDLITTLLDTTITFLFEPVDFPFTDADLDGFEDLCWGFASSVARQIRVMIRGLLGTLLRGVWEYSLHTDALIEVVATVVGVAFSAILESVARNLTWSVRIVSRYKGDPHGGAPGLAIPSLDRSSPITGSGILPQDVEYVAFFRNKGLAAVPISVGPTLRGLLKDLAAYIDASYQRFRTDRRFPAIATDNVSAIFGEITGKVFTLRADSLAQVPIFGNLPRPVLRAYFGNHMVVMAPGPNLADNYEMQFEFTTLPRKSFEVTVLSSRGGFGTAVIEVMPP